MEEPVPQKLPDVPIQEEEPRKHNLLPVLVPGLLLTLIASFLAIYYNSISTSVTKELASPQVNPLFVAVDAPQGAATIVNGYVLVAGRTLPGATVVIFSDEDDRSVDTGTTGFFEESILVGDDGGPIQIIAYGEDGSEEEITMDIAPGSQVLGKTDAPGQVRKAATETETVTRGNSTNKPEDTPKPTKTPKPTPSQSQSQRIKEFRQTTQTDTKPDKKLTPADLKLILASESAGLGRGRNIKLASAEASIASGGAMLKRHAIQGVITAIANGMFTIAHQIQRDRINSVYYNALTTFSMKGEASPSASLVTIGMRIAAVGDSFESGILAKRIHVIAGNAAGIFKRFPVATGSGDSSHSATPIETPTDTPTSEITP